jgi:hypothetical protein
MVLKEFGLYVDDISESPILMLIFFGSFVSFCRIMTTLLSGFRKASIFLNEPDKEIIFAPVCTK